MKTLTILALVLMAGCEDLKLNDCPPRIVTGKVASLGQCLAGKYREYGECVAMDENGGIHRGSDPFVIGQTVTTRTLMVRRGTECVPVE